MRKLVIATVAAGLAATPALAQGQVSSPEDRGFTGPRVEGVVGWDHVRDQTPGGGRTSSDGVVYGGQLGYDFQAGGAVLGVEGELTGSSTDTDAFDVAAPGDRLRLKAKRDLYIGGRVGYAVTPSTLLYAKAGYTNARIGSDYSTTTGNTTTTVSTHEDFDGYRVGAGAELKLSGNAYLKGEYRYSHYGDQGGMNLDVDRHQVIGGVGIRF